MNWFMFFFPAVLVYVLLSSSVLGIMNIQSHIHKEKILNISAIATQGAAAYLTMIQNLKEKIRLFKSVS